MSGRRNWVVEVNADDQDQAFICGPYTERRAREIVAQVEPKLKGDEDSGVFSVTCWPLRALNKTEILREWGL